MAALLWASVRQALTPVAAGCVRSAVTTQGLVQQVEGQSRSPCDNSPPSQEEWRRIKNEENTDTKQEKTEATSSDCLVSALHKHHLC